MIEERKIPRQWQLKKLGELCKPKEGLRRGPFGSAIKKVFFVPEGYKVYEQSNAIYNDAKRGKYFINENKYKELINFNVVPGDLIVSCSGTLGKISEIPIDAKSGIINQALLRIRLQDDVISKKFFLYYFRSTPFQRRIFDQSQGTAMNNLIGIKDFKEIELLIPPFSVQHLIVSKIEELFSELDKGIENLKAAQQQLKVYRQAVLKWAFEGKLTAKWRSKNINKGSQVRILPPLAAEAKMEYKTLSKKNGVGTGLEPATPSIAEKEGFEPPANFPEDWQKIKIKDVCSKIVGGGTPSTNMAEYWNGDIPWITSADIYGIRDVRPRKKISRKGIENSATNLLSKGGIIVVTRVSLGRIAIAPYDLCFSQDNQGLILNEDLILKEYAMWVLNKEVQIFIHQSRGTTIKGVTKKQLEDLQISLPPLKEQVQVVSEIEDRLSVCDKMEETIENSLKQAEALRQSILKKAFEGKLI